METCPLCDPKIIYRDHIFESKYSYVIYNHKAMKNYGRCIVIPKRHVAKLNDMTALEAIDLFKTVYYVSQKLHKYLDAKFYNYGFNEGEQAGQTIPHFHFHILPRYENDGYPEFHLFHRPENKKCAFKEAEIIKYVTEFRKILKK
jgi:ATP adenylyltransferase